MASTFIDPGLVTSVLDLRPGDHLCLIYDDDPAEQLPLILPFIRQGLENGERCVYVADDHTAAAFRTALADYGVDVPSEEAAGALLLWTRADWRQSGDLDSARKAEQVRGMIGTALSRGFKGIRFGVEMTWTLGPDIDPDDLRHWEATINAIFTPELPARIICQYSRSRLSPRVVQAGICTHPIVAVGDEMMANPFYEGPAILTGFPYGSHASGPDHVDWMVAQMRWVKALDREREQRIRAEAQADASQAMAQLAAIVESSEDAIVSKSLDGTIRSWNPAAERIFGYSADEMIGRSIRLIIPQDRQHEEDEVLGRIISGDRVDHFETVRVRKDGREIVVSLTISPIRDAAGTVIGASKVARDITEKRQAEDAVRKSEDRFRTLTGLAPVGIFVTDVSGECSFVNEHWQSLAGIASADAVGEGWLRALHPDDAERVASEWSAAAGSGRPFESEYRFRRPDATVVWLQGRAEALRGPHGEVTGYIGTITDITELKKLQLAREEFLGLMSHELRTPITTVYGAARVLEVRSDRIDEDSRIELVRHIRENAERLNRMIENLLVLARLDAKKSADAEPVLIAHVVREVARTFAVSRKREPLSVEVEPDLPLVAGQTGLVEHILQNLLTNAEKYSEPGAEISLRVVRDGERVVVSVLDRGIGVAPGEEELLFEQFYRSPRSSSATGGAGLGLTVCLRLVEAQHGRIWAERREGGGLIVSFTLPCMSGAT